MQFSTPFRDNYVIIYSINLIVVQSGKDVSVAISKDGKTAATKAAKVGDTLTALVTPSKAADQVEYQWYVLDEATYYTYAGKNDAGQDVYTLTKTPKWTAISGETKSTYAPTKAGTYGVRIQITPAGQRAGYQIKSDKDVYSWAQLNVSAKSFENVTPYAYDMYTNETSISDSTDGGNLNAVNDPFQVVVPGLTFGINHDYTIQWMIQPKGAKDTEVYAVDTEGATSPLLNPRDNAETITYNNGKEAQPGDKLFAVIIGATNSAYAGQTAESNKITLTKGALAKVKQYFYVKGEAVNSGDKNYNRYTATVMKQVNKKWSPMTDTSFHVTWYTTNDASVAQKYVGGAAIDSTTGLTLADNQSTMTNLFQYAGSKDEIGGKYVVAVISSDNYVGKIAVTATATENGNVPFEFANTTAK